MASTSRKPLAGAPIWWTSKRTQLNQTKPSLAQIIIQRAKLELRRRAPHGAPEATEAWFLSRSPAGSRSPAASAGGSAARGAQQAWSSRESINARGSPANPPPASKGPVKGEWRPANAAKPTHVASWQASESPHDPARPACQAASLSPRPPLSPSRRAEFIQFPHRESLFKVGAPFKLNFPPSSRLRRLVEPPRPGRLSGGAGRVVATC